jgi:hypothetical protein
LINAKRRTAFALDPDESIAVTAADLVARARCEFLEMPGLHVTPAQAARLWQVNQEVASAVLDALADARFLVRTRAGSFAQRSE